MEIKAYEAEQFYYKLHQCLRLALENDDLNCHANTIIVELAKSIESQNTYYNPNMDVWCSYFLQRNKQAATPTPEVTRAEGALREAQNSIQPV